MHHLREYKHISCRSGFPQIPASQISGNERWQEWMVLGRTEDVVIPRGWWRMLRRYGSGGQCQ